jgi:hypothetical protein
MPLLQCNGFFVGEDMELLSFCYQVHTNTIEVKHSLNIDGGAMARLFAESICHTDKRNPA